MRSLLRGSLPWSLMSFWRRIMDDLPKMKSWKAQLCRRSANEDADRLSKIFPPFPIIVLTTLTVIMICRRKLPKRSLGFCTEEYRQWLVIEGLWRLIRILFCIPLLLVSRNLSFAIKSPFCQKNKIK